MMSSDKNRASNPDDIGDQTLLPDRIRTLNCRGRMLELGGRTLIMGILNVTPDSFSDGGKYTTVEAAVRQAVKLAEDGADILDIGGESTRPGADKVELQEELHRIIPVIEAIRSEIDIPLSVDTYKPEVARQALEAGAHILNDIWGFKFDPQMAAIAASYEDVPVILMHNRPATRYTDFISDVISDLEESVRIAQGAGISDQRIILDPGIGFAKTQEHNLRLMSKLHELRAIGYPLLLGTSRKSFIRSTLDLPADDVVEGTAATVAIGIAQGCEIMRVHDVRQMKRVALMCDAIVRFQPS